MIRITEDIWIGGYEDWQNANVVNISAVLNVARDLSSERTMFGCSWPKVEYMQVGLIDGPGNTISAYTSAILALHTLLKRKDAKKILVCCHGGRRSLAVVIMYLIIKRGKVSAHPTFFNYWISWDKMLDELLEQVKHPLPELHPAHKEVFDKMPLFLIESLL